MLTTTRGVLNTTPSYPQPISNTNNANLKLPQTHKKLKPQPIFTGGKFQEGELFLKWPSDENNYCNNSSTTDANSEDNPSESDIDNIPTQQNKLLFSPLSNNTCYSNSSISSMLEAISNESDEDKENLPMKTFEKSPFADHIIDFLNPFLGELKHQPPESKPQEGNVMQHIVLLLKEYAARSSTRTKELMQHMNAKRLVVPYIELDLPGDIVLEFNELEEEDPLVLSYQFHPIIGKHIRELGVFLDRYDTIKEVLCLFVWSTVDNTLVCLPSVGLIPYPLCWMCKESFGMSACGNCGVAKYCSKDCQQLDWTVSHKSLCKEMATFAQRHQVLYIE